MILVDVNVLVYAHDETSRHHAKARLWWENQLNGTQMIGLSWVGLLGFIRLLTNPRILIFDEATSALDYESERIIQDNMAAIGKGRTVLIIAHRLSTVRGADRIVTIEGGRLVEDGTHDQLLRTNGRYARLYRYQSGVPSVGGIGAAE